MLRERDLLSSRAAAVQLKSKKKIASRELRRQIQYYETMYDELQECRKIESIKINTELRKLREVIFSMELQLHHAGFEIRDDATPRFHRNTISPRSDMGR